MRSQTGFDGFYAVMIVVLKDILDRRENVQWHHPSTTFYDGKVWSGTVGKADGHQHREAQRWVLSTSLLVEP